MDLDGEVMAYPHRRIYSPEAVELARLIREAIRSKAYDLKMREGLPRTDLGQERYDERTCELAAELIRLRASPAPDPVRTGLADDERILRQFIADGANGNRARLALNRLITRASPQSVGNPLGSGMRDVICDCQQPEEINGQRLISNSCPIHNENPDPPLPWPDVSPEQERVARIIDPEAWAIYDDAGDYIGHKFIQPSLAKAEAILSAEGEGWQATIYECADIADKYDDCGGAFIAEKIRDLALPRPTSGGGA